MAAARKRQGQQEQQGQQAHLSFGQLHALSAAFCIVKTGLVLALVWWAARPAAELQA